MSNVMERVKAHFKDRLSNGVDSVVVPEWGEGDAPLVIYFRPTNLATQNAIYKHIRDGSLEALVEQLIQQARDEDGNKIFRASDRIELMKHADPAVISRVVKAMNDVEEITPEDIEKN